MQKKSKKPIKKQTKNVSGVEYIVAKNKFNKRVLVSIPMTGLLRAEWHLAFLSQVIPTNWSHVTSVVVFSHYTPIGFLVADARNLAAQKVVEDDYEWLIFIDHDVVLPIEVFRTFNLYMLKKDVPVIGGLYFTRSVPAEPLLYRGRGNSYYTGWKMGDKVWCDGMGLGCHLIHHSILKAMYDESEEYHIQTHPNGPILTTRRVFESPSTVVYSEELGGLAAHRGTEDLPWYARIMDEGFFKKAGWPKFARKKYPFLCDTRLFCKHIDHSGVQYPMNGEENEFKRAEK